MSDTFSPLAQPDVGQEADRWYGNLPRDWRQRVDDLGRDSLLYLFCYRCCEFLLQRHAKPVPEVDAPLQVFKRYCHQAASDSDLQRAHTDALAAHAAARTRFLETATAVRAGQLPPGDLARARLVDGLAFLVAVGTLGDAKKAAACSYEMVNTSYWRDSVWDQFLQWSQAYQVPQEMQHPCNIDSRAAYQLQQFPAMLRQRLAEFDVSSLRLLACQCASWGLQILNYHPPVLVEALALAERYARGQLSLADLDQCRPALQLFQIDIEEASSEQRAAEVRGDILPQNIPDSHDLAGITAAVVHCTSTATPLDLFYALSWAHSAVANFHAEADRRWLESTWKEITDGP